MRFQMVNATSTPVPLLWLTPRQLQVGEFGRELNLVLTPLRANGVILGVFLQRRNQHASFTTYSQKNCD
jgi:hypothetical protein